MELGILKLFYTIWVMRTTTKIKRLERRISWMYECNFDKSRRVALWYVVCRKLGYEDALEYSFYKVYGLWGVDSLQEDEIKSFYNS